MENKKRTTIGFWGKEGKNGKFYSSIKITQEIMDLLKQAELGGQLMLNYNTFEDRAPNSPDVKLAFVSRAKVEERAATFTNSDHRKLKQELKASAEADI